MQEFSIINLCAVVLMSGDSQSKKIIMSTAQK